MWSRRDDRGEGVFARVILAVILALCLMLAPLTGAADESLLLEVVVNGHPIGKVGEFVLRDGALFARAKELRDLGFRVPDAAAPTADTLVPLTALAGLTARLDQATQTLAVSAANDRLLPALLPVGSEIPLAGAIESGTGMTLNYDLTGTRVGGQTLGSGLFDVRAFSPWGVASTGLLGYAGASPRGPGTSAAIRLDSGYVYSDANSMRRYRLGDFINGGLAWTRPIRLGGAEINSDFSMRPDLVTFPLPTLTGAAAVPSTVDVLVNGTRLLSQQVQPGPFQIPRLPVITGAGTVSMTLTDPLGRQVTTTLPVYASSDLLAPGLQTYAIEVGAIRRNWGLVSNDYGAPVGSATYRRGLAELLTIEAHAEGGSGVVMGGAGLVVNVADLAVLNFAAAGSSASGRSGTQFSLGAERTGQLLSLAASAIVAGTGYRDVAAQNGTPTARLQLNASAGLSLGRFGSLGLAYTAIDRSAVSAPVTFFAPPGTFASSPSSVSGGLLAETNDIVTFTPAQHAHVASASYSVQVKGVAVFATGFHDFANSGSTGFLAGFTVPLGARSSASVGGGTASSGGYGQMEAMQTVDNIGDAGYQAYASAGRPDHVFAQLDYKSPWALVSAGADRIDGQSSLRAEAQGALSFADAAVFASNTIDDSFAVVDTSGVKGIRVTAENRDAGRTDADGKLLLPELRSFDINHIAIEPVDVPIDASVPTTTREIRPQDRSGVVVRFPIRRSQAALLRLVDATGRPLPMGSVATLRATGASSSVGYEGEAYIEELSAHNELAVEQPGGRRCALQFAYRPTPGTIPVLGPLRCQEAQP